MKKLTPMQAIKAVCKDCKETSTEVKNCNMKECALYLFKGGKRVLGVSKLKAIRKYCLWCMNDQYTEVDLCPTEDCSFFIYRAGKNPSLTGSIRGGSFKKKTPQVPNLS